VGVPSPADRRERPRLLVFNQYYWPGVEATGQLLSQLCSGLASDFEVTVVTGKLRDVPAIPAELRTSGRTEHEGVEVVRVASTAFDRRRLLLRALNYVTFLASSLWTGLRAKRPRAVLCMTDPPIIANAALVVAHRFRSPLVVVSQDVFPEIAVQLRRLENPVVVGLLRRAIHYYLARADRVVAIGDTMRRRLVEKAADPARVRVIPNWVDTEELTPEPRENEWARAHGLAGRFVVMHSGNVGHAQNLDVLVRAATFLRDLDDLVIAIVGDGARRAELEALAELLEADLVHFLPYQPRDVLPMSLSAADVHVVGLAHGLSGYVVPSRLYGVLSVARPVIVAADAESETAQVVAQVGCGLVIPPGRPELLAAAVRRAHDAEIDLEEMGKRGRAYVRQEADRKVAVARYRELISELIERDGQAA
jgi:colanic acid biosynthesis glycosyl transferase WcaI